MPSNKSLMALHKFVTDSETSNRFYDVMFSASVLAGHKYYCYIGEAQPRKGMGDTVYLYRKDTCIDTISMDDIKYIKSYDSAKKYWMDRMQVELELVKKKLKSSNAISDAISLIPMIEQRDELLDEIDKMNEQLKGEKRGSHIYNMLTKGISMRTSWIRQIENEYSDRLLFKNRVMDDCRRFLDEKKQLEIKIKYLKYIEKYDSLRNPGALSIPEGSGALSIPENSGDLSIVE